MALISGGVPNLHQGVSQQPDPLRDPTQGDLQVNGVSSPIGGLRKREGSYSLAKISSTQAPFWQVAFHHIRRDDFEQYLAVINRSTVRVFRLGGSEVPVTMAPTAAGYLMSAGDPSLDLKCVTVGDITFVSSTKIKPSMNVALTPVAPRPSRHEALVWVKSANYGQIYQLSVNGVTAKVETAITPTTTTEDGVVKANRISPEDIAEQLRGALVGGAVYINGGLWLAGGEARVAQMQPNVPTSYPSWDTKRMMAHTNGPGKNLVGTVTGDGSKIINIQWEFSESDSFIAGEKVYFTKEQLGLGLSTDSVHVATVTAVYGPAATKTTNVTNIPVSTDRGGSGLKIGITFEGGRVKTIYPMANSKGTGYVEGDKIFVQRSVLYNTQETTAILIGVINSAAPGRLNGVQIDVSSSTLHLKSKDQMTIIASGGQGNGEVKSILDRVQSLVELPAVAPNGYMVEIEGDRANNSDSYYVKFAAASFGFGDGLWEETTAAGVEYRINQWSMPHLLVRADDGRSFWFGPALVPGAAQPFAGAILPTWGQRVSGDYVSSPNPSFIGAAIKDVFVYNNRLCFLSGESVTCSRTGKFFDFFRETVVTVLDSDPVDLSASQDQISYLTYAVPFQNEVILFSEEMQFRLHSGGDPFTATTARVDVLTNYQCDLGARPAPMAGAVVFPQRNGNWTQFREYRIYGSGTSVNADGTDITTQVNNYIPASVRRIAVNEAGNILIALSDKKCYRNRLYIYKYLNESEGGATKRTQSSWSYWEFCTDEIKTILMVDQTLYMVCRYGEEIWLEGLPTNDRPQSYPLGAAQSDEPLLLPHEIYLDRKFTNTLRSAPGARVPPGVYDPITDTTTWTLPFIPRCRVQAWTAFLGKDICAVCVTIDKVGDATVTSVPATCVTVLAIKDATTPPPDLPPMPPPVCVTVMSVKDANTTPPAPP